MLATGAAPFVPPVPGRDLDGCFVYRTIDDLEAIRDAAAGAPASGAVVGGGLLGLEAANALAQLGLETHVVEMAPRLMPVQVDEAGGATLRRHVEKLGVHVHTGAMTERGHRRGRPGRPGWSSTGRRAALDADVVVFSAGIRPARRSWPATPACRRPSAAASWSTSSAAPSDPHVWAIGECAAPAGRMYGLVAPGYAMAEVVVDALLGGAGAFTGADMSTKLKLLGVDVASFGDAFATTAGALELVYSDAGRRASTRSSSSPRTAARLLGGILVGDASAYGVLRPMVASRHRAARQPRGADPARGPRRRPARRRALPDDAQVCSCNNVTKAADRRRRREPTSDGGRCDDVACVTRLHRAGSTCGSCVGW